MVTRRLILFLPKKVFLSAWKPARREGGSHEPLRPWPFPVASYFYKFRGLGLGPLGVTQSLILNKIIVAKDKDERMYHTYYFIIGMKDSISTNSLAP